MLPRIGKPAPAVSEFDSDPDLRISQSDSDRFPPPFPVMGKEPYSVRAGNVEVIRHCHADDAVNLGQRWGMNIEFAGVKRTGLRVALLALVLAFPFLGSRGIWEPDEGRYTNVAINMVESGDWLNPRRNDDVGHWTKRKTGVRVN